MKKNLFKHLSTGAFLFVMIFAAGCGKDGDDADPTVKNLTSSKWVLEDMTSDDLDDLSLSIFAAFFDSYELTYNADGSFISYFPALGEDGTSEGTWELSSDNKMLIHDKGTDFETQNTIVTLSSSELVLTFDSENEESGEVYNVTMHFKH